MVAVAAVGVVDGGQRAVALPDFRLVGVRVRRQPQDVEGVEAAADAVLQRLEGQRVDLPALAP